MSLIPEIKGDVQLKMSSDEARREAIGKALSLTGATIGIVGTIMALSVNPAVKQHAGGAFAKLPKGVQDNKIPMMIGMGLVGAVVAYWFIKRSVGKSIAERYT